MSGTKFKVKEYSQHQDSQGVLYEYGAEVTKEFPVEAPGGSGGTLVVNNDLEVKKDTELTGNLTVGSQEDPSDVQITGNVTINAEDSVNIVVEGDGTYSEVFKVTDTNGLAYFKINPGSAPTSGVGQDTSVYADGLITTRDVYAFNDLSSGNTLSAVTKATAPLVEVNTVTPISGQEVTITNNNDSDANQVVGLKLNDSEQSTSYLTLSEGTDGDGARFVYAGNTNDKLGVPTVNWGAIQGLDNGNVHNVLEFDRQGSLVNLEAGTTLSLAAPTQVDITTDYLDVNADRTDVSGNLLVNTLSPFSGDTLTITNVLDSTNPRSVSVFIKDTANSEASLVIGEGDSPDLTENAETGVILGARLHYDGVYTNKTSLQGLYKTGTTQTYNTVMRFDREGNELLLDAKEEIKIGQTTDVEIDALSSNFTTSNVYTKFDNPQGTLLMSGGVLGWSAKENVDHRDLTFQMDAAKFRMGSTPDLLDGTVTKYAFNITCPYANDGFEGSSSDVLFETAGSHFHVVRSSGRFHWGRDDNLAGTITNGITDLVMQLNTTSGAENLYVEGSVTSSSTVSQFTGSHLYFSEVEIEAGMALELSGDRAVLSSSPVSKICCGAAVKCFPIEQVDALILSANSLGIEVPETGYLVTVASVGDSRTKNCQGFNICNENGEVQAGDLLVTSSTPGYLMKQDDDIIRSCTVGKAMEDVVFNEGGQATGIYGYIYCG